MSAFSKLPLVKLNTNCAKDSWGRAPKVGRIANPGSGSTGVQSADSSVLPSASFFFALTQASLQLRYRCSSSSSEVTLLAGYNDIPRGSWSTSAF